ncbi:MAG: DUF1015 domain-containing protein [Clostridia bacterium]|nr:DUF1015 domain-containing protein [Clostridia bacterium]
MQYEGVGIVPANLLLPAAHVAAATWACVACDQYTSQPEYWAEAALQVADAPSCLKLVLPECYLPETEQRVPLIHAEMQKYMTDGTLTQQVTEGFVLVERSTASGQRVGLVCAVDLEQYDFTGVKSLIRPTEETITARLPARLAIRRGAPLESSHIMLLMDDPMQSVLEPLYAKRNQLPMVYDFPLMQGGGHLRGWALTEESEKKEIFEALVMLKMRLGEDPLLFAVGDGNHSLATAKAYWNEIKAGLTPEQQVNHPARFAMVEVENIHDDALQFEPIHRVLTGVNGQALMQDWTLYCHEHGMELSEVTQAGESEQTVNVIYGGSEIIAAVTNPDGPLPVATLQKYLDDFLARHPEAEIDYIHGDDVVRRLAAAPDAIGFLLPPLDKSAFFGAIDTLGILPRKTFSMGHAHEKRYYMECRSIV